MTQQVLFFDSLEDAAKELARNYPDGPKALAHRLRPAKSISAAYTWWLDCCNVSRTEHNFTGDDWLALIKIGREIGCHAVMHWLCDEAIYERAVPREPEDENTKLKREFISSVSQLSRLAERIQRNEELATAVPSGVRELRR